jgi:MoaA/NifB/PqqE/SkfB family radical SAM enzyme
VSRLVQLKKDARFAAGLAKKQPFNCLIQITNRCNLTCSFCDFWPNPAPKHEELKVAELERLGDELRELGTFLISIEGGEPFVRSDIFDVVRVLSKHHITSIFTSGWFMTAEHARRLWNTGLTHASVSIDFPDAARHDDKRGQPGTFDRAWRAVDHLRDAAPRGGKQVNVMTVLMKDNWLDMEALLEQTKKRGVGHQVTLLATDGTRRGKSGDEPPPLGVSEHMSRLFRRYPHLRFFEDYFDRIDTFLSGGAMPTCHAGAQAFNIDHVGNVASCIERIGKPVGNVRDAHLRDLYQRLLAEQDEISRCQQCWTACRGFQQAVAGGGSLRAWTDMTLRTSTY